MTKPNFIKRRIIALFESNDIKSQQLIVNKYNNIRKDKCYCGHTINCSCGDCGINEFKLALNNQRINEEILNKLL